MLLPNPSIYALVQQKTWRSEDAGSNSNLVPVLQRQVGADLELQTSSDNRVPPLVGK